jgi:hypothetical protein
VSGAEALGSALIAEHAAIFGYGAIGAHLDGDLLVAARQAEAAHRDRRDAVALRVTAAGATPAPAAAAYALPFPVSDATSAMRLAAAVEEGAAGAWREALAATTGDDRKVALDALIACAVMATRWRASAGIVPTTLTYPGATAS